MEDHEKISVLVAHHEPVVRFGLSEIIRGQAQMRVCGQAATAAAAREMCAQLKPAIVIFDPAMDGGGTGLLRELPRWSPKTRMVVFTASDDVASMQRAVASGALGYVTRLDPITDLVIAIQTVLTGHRHVGSHLSHLLLDELARGAVKLNGSAAADLSDREMQVFQLIGQGKGTRAVAEELHVSPKTIETHRQRIKSKLHLHSGAELQQRAALYHSGHRRRV